MQAGFAETEIAATSFLLEPSDFPLRVDLMEMIFATRSSTVQTTTHWSVMVWEGTPDNGTLVATFSSDGVLLPHIVLPPGDNGVNVAVSVDPGDPDQIIVTDDGSHTFSFGYRIDQHEGQVGSGCDLGDLPTCCNAFPVVDVSGLSSFTGNWLMGINCGPLGCPDNGGWANFQQLPGGPGQLCTPRGDWVMRVSWTALDCSGEPGACCLADGSCLDVTPDDCEFLQGGFEGQGSSCAATTCPEADQACCFVNGSCLDLPPSSCEPAGGFPQGLNSICGQTECFASGACCLPDGTCADDMSPENCVAKDGLYQGSDTSCGGVECPDPLGACCFPTDFCLVLTEDECSSVGADWSGAQTDCTDADGDQVADVCESNCVADLTGDGQVDAADLADLLVVWGVCGDCSADFDGDGKVDAADLADLLVAWGSCP